MNKDVLDRYDELRMAVSGNINTIRALLMQADKLNGIVSELADDDEKKQELEKSIKGLYRVINQLIKQTNSLFQQYAEFAQSVSKART